jgi:hypothetical protein
MGNRYRNAIVNLRHKKAMHHIPKWADRTKIQEFYRNIPEGLTIDHIIPLRGKLVSGFHVVENLQYMKRKDNLKKGNEFEPIIIQAQHDV